MKTDSWQTRSPQFHNSITADSSVHTAQGPLDIAVNSLTVHFHCEINNALIYIYIILLD